MNVASRLVLGAIVVAISLCTYWPQRNAALDLRQDDHRILFAGSAGPLHDQVRGARGPGGLQVAPTLEWALVSDATEGGRFRPVTQALEILLPRLLGTDAALWHAVLLGLAAIASASLFLAGLGVFGSAQVAALFALMVMLAPDPGPARTWYMMSTKAEAVGTLLVAWAIVAASRAATGRNRRAWDVAGVACVLLAGLTKESFVLVIPALVALRVWLEARESRASAWQSVRRLPRLIAIYGGVFFGQMVAIGLTVSASTGDSYGGSTFRASSVFLDGLSRTLQQLPGQSVWFVPMILAAYGLLRTHGPAGTLRASAPILAMGVLWIVPQVVLYGARGGMWDHYWLPCVIGIAGLNAAALGYLHQGTHKRLYGAAVLAALLWVANGVRVNVQSVANFVERTHARQAALAGVVQRTPDSGKVLVVADGATDSEHALSWVFFLADQGRSRAKVFLYDTRTGHQGRFSTAPFFPHSAALADMPACDFSAIVFLGQPEKGDLDWKTWFSKGCHETREFSRPQRYLSLKHLGWTTGQFSVSVALKSQ